jgi:hypothetical protein
LPGSREIHARGAPLWGKSAPENRKEEGMRAVSMLAFMSVVAASAVAAPPKPAPTTPAVPPVPLTITLYDQENFKGRAVRVSAATPNLAALQIEDRVASFDRNYKGVCARVQAKASDLRVLQLFGRVSSLYPVPAPAAPAAPVQ